MVWKNLKISEITKHQKAEQKETECNLYSTEFLKIYTLNNKINTVK